MGTALQMPGWGNSFTQPITNRVEMLSTGRPPAGRREGLRLGPGADPEGHGGDRRRAPRHPGCGRRVPRPDHRQAAMSRSTSTARRRRATASTSATSRTWSRWRWAASRLTMTVEGRERYPVRVRYARAYRDDVDALKRILVTAARADGWRAEAAGVRRPVPQVPLAQLADVKVVEGPSVIKSENGLLRAYVQLERPGSRRGRVRRGGASGRRREGRAAPAAGHVRRMVGDVRAPGPRPEDAAARLPGGDRHHRPDPLPDTQELDRRPVDDDQRARSAGGRGDLPVALRLQLSAWRCRSATSPASAWRSRRAS